MVEKAFVAARDDVDDGVADPDHVVASAPCSRSALAPVSLSPWCCAARPLYSVAGRNTSCSAPQVKPSAIVHAALPRRAVQMRRLHHRALRSSRSSGSSGPSPISSQWPGWIETSIQWLGGLALVVGSIFLIPPVTSLIAGLYLDDIAAVVEREHYPADPPGAELPTLQAIGVALQILLRRAAGEPARAVPSADPRRQSDRLLSSATAICWAANISSSRRCGTPAGRGEGASGRQTG